MYEIWEERLVTRDGENEDASRYKADLHWDGPPVEVRLQDVSILRVAVEDKVARVRLTDLLEAVADLRRLAGMSDELSSEVVEAHERLAGVVERTCAELEKDGDPVRQTLATDLRTTVLALLP